MCKKYVKYILQLMDICMALMKNIYAICIDMWYICCIVRNSAILHIFLKYVSIYIALYETYIFPICDI